jgi:hypothetical protein
MISLISETVFEAEIAAKRLKGSQQLLKNIEYSKNRQYF